MADEFTFATPELESEYQSALATLQKRLTSTYESTPTEQRTKDLETVLQEGQQELFGEYQRISAGEELRLQIETNQIPEQYISSARTTLEWYQHEADLIREEIRIDKAVQSCITTLNTLGVPTPWSRLAESLNEPIIGPQPYTESQAYTDTMNLYNTYLKRLDEIAVERERSVVYQTMYEALPSKIASGEITSFKDLFKYKAFQDIGEDDKELEAAFDSIYAATLGLPTGTKAEDTNYDEIIRQLAQKPTYTGPVTLQQATVSSILSALIAPESIPTLPQGMTSDEALQVYSEAGIPEDTINELEGIEAYSKQVDELWNTISTNTSAIRQGLTNAKLPELGLWGNVRLFFAQPLQVGLDVLSLFYTEWTQPWGAWLFGLKARSIEMLAPQALTPQEEKFLTKYRTARDTMNWWDAGQYASENTSWGFWNRLFFEWVMDPTTWLGTGLLKAAAGKIPVVGRYAGPVVGKFDDGWAKAWDVLIFDRIKSAGKLIEKTPTQISRQFGGRDMVAVYKYLHAVTNGRKPGQVPLTEAIEHLVNARNFALNNPNAKGEIADAGMALLRSPEINEPMVKKLMVELGSEVPITNELVLTLSSIVNGQFPLSRKGLLPIAGKGTPIPKKGLVPFLLRTLDVPEVPANVIRGTELLNDLLKLGIANSDVMLAKAKNTPDILTKIYANSQKACYVSLESAAAHNLEMSGRVAASISRVDWKVMTAWRNTIDRWMVTPTARMYLAFSAYGPFNVLEGVIKQVAAKQIPYIPISQLKGSKLSTVVNPAARMQRLFAGLKYTTDLMTGTPMIQMAGELPTLAGLEKQSAALVKWRYWLSGGPVGKYLIDVPGRIGLQQRADYLRKMFLTKLTDDEFLAPIAQQLTLTIDKHVKPISDSIMRAINLNKYEFREELFERSMNGTRNIRAFIDDMVTDRLKIDAKISRETAFSDKIASGRVAEAMGKYTLVDEPFQDAIIQKAADGSLYRNKGTAINESIEGVIAAKYDYVVHSPQYKSAVMKEYVDGLLSTEVKSKDDLIYLMQELQNLQSSFREATDDVIRSMEELEAKISKQMKWYDFVEWRANYTVGKGGVYEGLSDYARQAKESLDALDKKFQDILSGRPGVANLSDTDRVIMRDWLEPWMEEQRYLATFWAERRNIEAAEINRISKLKGEEKTIAWQQFKLDQGRAHAKRREVQLSMKPGLFQRSALASEFLGVAGPKPPIIDASGRKLTKMDVANLFHSHSQSAAQAVLRFDTMTLKPKEDFIVEVVAQANRMAESVGKSSYQLGWVESAIGDVYDSILRDMRMFSEVSSVMEPFLMQIKEMETELWSIYNTKAVPKETVDELQTMLDNLADELEEIPGYAEQVIPSIKTAEVGVIAELEEEAIELYRTASRLQPDNPNVVKYGNYLKQYGRAKTAKARFVLMDEMDHLEPPIRAIVAGHEVKHVARPVAVGLTDEFVAAKQRVLDSASKEYYKDWADYTNENTTTAIMRSILPFWTYEAHRWFWLLRATLRYPGMFKSWGTYMNNTDNGYIHIPGSSLEINPFRGTIFSGGMSRLIRQDYPDYYDMFPEIAEFSDFYSRFGFYPAAYLNVLKLIGGTSAGGKMQIGEVLPALVKTPLNAYIAAFPKSRLAKSMLNTILPEPYRNYTTVQLANAICQRERRTFSGMEIYDKMRAGEKLTEEENDVWTRATREQGWMGILMEQSGMMRIKTGEQITAWKESAKFIEEVTGYTEEQQLWLRTHGFRVGDYAQLDPLAQDVLSEMDIVKYHSGLYSLLMPTAWQEEDRLRREFYRLVGDYGDQLKLEQEDLDRRIRLPSTDSGWISMEQWRSGRSEIRTKYSNYFTALAESDKYNNIPLEMDDTTRSDGTVREGLVSYLANRKQLPPVMSPAEELLNYYYSLKLEKTIDESGALIDDWDGYFLRIDTIINTLSEVNRKDFVTMITKNMTDLERLRWTVSREYFRGYNRRQEAILYTQFSPDQQELIKRWIFGTPTERTELEAVLMSSGEKLIATYQSMIRQTGLNLRRLSPELDAWLLFFEITESTQSTEAQSLYEQHRREWGLRV